MKIKWSYCPNWTKIQFRLSPVGHYNPCEENKKKYDIIGSKLENKIKLVLVLVLILCGGLVLGRIGVEKSNWISLFVIFLFFCLTGIIMSNWTQSKLNLSPVWTIFHSKIKHMALVNIIMM